jgi:hypothetical protein
MAKVFGEKSKYLINKDANNFFAGGIFLVALFVLIFLYSQIGNVAIASGLGIPAAVIFLILYFFVKSKSEKLLNKSINFSHGRNGEYDVCDELEKLPEAYSIFRNVKIGNYGDIDLVVTGPTGIFTIEVKSHKGNVYFNSTSQRLERGRKPFEKNFIGQAKSEAYNLKNYLTQDGVIKFVFVNAALVFSNDKANLNFYSNVAPQIQIVKKESLNNLIINNSSTILGNDQLLIINNKLLALL